MIAAVTVTYNSSHSLIKTVEALLAQTINVDKIIITDNNSSHLHKENLKKIQLMSSKIEIVWLTENTGGAGGFYSSIKYARDKYSPDWFWLMDDDAYPDPDCLEVLLNYNKVLNDVGFLAPAIWGIDKNKYQLYHARRKKGYLYKFTPISDDINCLNDVELIDVDAFVGPLIPGEVVKEIGLPRGDYFIEGDDTDYTYRISRIHKGYFIKNAKMNHRDVVATQGINPKGWWKDYYWFRNSILFPINNLKGVHKILSIFEILIWAYKMKIKMRVNPDYKSYYSFRWGIMKRGISDGLKRKYGANLLPEDYIKILEQWEKERRKY